MNTRSFCTMSALALLATAGCSARTAADDGSEDTLETASAISSESTGEDPVEDGMVSDGDVTEASAEAAESGFDAPRPVDLGCGVRKAIRVRIKEHFDANGDGKLDASERHDLKAALGDHPRLKLELAKLGIQARHHVWRRIVWAYDVDGDGSLDKGERADLASAVQARCEARKVRVLATWDANKDGQLDDGELKAAIEAFVKARRERFFQVLARVDTNDDRKIDDAERAAARKALAARYQAKRDAVKARYDVNGDGKLDESELAALKTDLRARFENVPPAE